MEKYISRLKLNFMFHVFCSPGIYGQTSFKTGTYPSVQHVVNKRHCHFNIVRVITSLTHVPIAKLIATIDMSPESVHDFRALKKDF